MFVVKLAAFTEYRILYSISVIAVKLYNITGYSWTLNRWQPLYYYMDPNWSHISFAEILFSISYF